MKKRSLSGILILLLASLLANIFLVTKTIPNYVVNNVIDGDTFVLKNGERIRLLGVNAPELKNCGSEEAKTLLTKLIINRPVIIKEIERDYYGRRMGLVYIGTKLVNIEIIKQGWGRPDYTKNSQNEGMKIAYKEAKDNKRGVHSELCKHIAPTPPNPSCTIKGNIDLATWSHLYHLPSCRHYSQIVLNEDIGEQFFCSEKEAQDAGFTLAPDCLR